MCMMMLDVIHIEFILMFKYGHLQNIIPYEQNINAQKWTYTQHSELLMFKYEHNMYIINYNFNLNAQIWSYAEYD